MNSPSTNTSGRARLKAWADERGNGLPAGYRLLRLFVRLLFITAGEFSSNALSLRSAALTYTVLLSLVPILAMSAAVVKGLGGDDQLRRVAYSYIDTLTDRDSETETHEKPTAPSQQETGSAREKSSTLTGHLRSAVDQLFDYVDKTNFATLGSIGILGVLLSVILLLSYIEETMNSIWKVAGGRPLLRKIADYLTLLILLPISINVAFAASAMLQSPALISRIDLLIPLAWLQTIILKAVPVAVITLTFSIMYIFFPNTRVRPLPALFGAGLAAVLWTMAQNIYIALQIGVANYNAIYGSFATLPLFLVWMYVGWLFILTGAQVAYACQNMQTFRLMPLAAAPSLKLGAAFDIMDTLVTAFKNAKTITGETLADSLQQYQPALISEVVMKLEGAGLVHVSQTDNRLLPGSSEKDHAYRTAVSLFLGSDTAATSGGARSQRIIEAAVMASDTDAPPAKPEP